MGERRSAPASAPRPPTACSSSRRRRSRAGQRRSARGLAWSLNVVTRSRVPFALAMYNSYIMKRTQIYLDRAQDERLAHRARSRGATKSTLIREAIEEYLAKPDADARLADLRGVLDELSRSPLQLVDGAAYVEGLRATD